MKTLVSNKPKTIWIIKIITKLLKIADIILAGFMGLLVLLPIVSFFVDKFFFKGYLFNWIINLMIINIHYSHIFDAFENNFLAIKIYFCILIVLVIFRIILNKIILKFIDGALFKTIILSVINFIAYCFIFSFTILLFSYMIILGYVINIYNETNPNGGINFSHQDLENIGTYLIDKHSSSAMMLKQIIYKIETGEIDINRYSNIQYRTLALNICNLFVDKGNVDTEEEHYLRNYFSRAPETLSEMIYTIKNNNTLFGWKLLPSEKYTVLHMNGMEGAYNLKFLSKDGHFEAVYNKDGILLTQYNDPLNMGTFNYADQVLNKEKHFVLDVIPYGRWGNTKDSLPWLYPNENLEGNYDPSVFTSNPGAVEWFNNIYKIIYGEEYKSK